MPPRHTLWVRGPSGAGKSQLLKRLAHLVPGPGSVSLGDHTPQTLGAPAWRADVVYVGQRPPAITETGEQLALHVAHLRQQRHRDHDDPVAIAASWGLPASRWGQPLSMLSGGELQRLWLAIVVSRRPQVLLLDEPTSALDAEATAAVEATVRPFTTVWTTHDAAQGSRVADATLTLGPTG